jgi:copper chaperone CopZ
MLGPIYDSDVLGTRRLSNPHQLGRTLGEDRILERTLADEREPDSLRRATPQAGCLFKTANLAFVHPATTEWAYAAKVVSRTAAATRRSRMFRVELRCKGVDDDSAAKVLEKALRGVAGVKEASVKPSSGYEVSGYATVVGTATATDKALVEAVEAAGRRH